MALAPPRLASAQTRDECVAAHLDAQRARRAGRLTDARVAATACAQGACPGLIAADCAAWKSEIDEIMPSLSFESHGADGRETVEVRVSLDGRVLLERLDGKAHDVDPGSHELIFETAGKAPVRQTIVVREGEKRRKVTVAFASAAPPRTSPVVPQPAADADESRPVPVLTFVLAGVSVAALGGFVALAVHANGKKSDLEQCGGPPSTCDRAEVDATRREYIFANVALGVAVVAAGAATIVYLTRPSRPPMQTRAPRTPPSRRAGWPAIVF